MFGPCLIAMGGNRVRFRWPECYIPDLAFNESDGSFDFEFDALILLIKVFGFNGFWSFPLHYHFCNKALEEKNRHARSSSNYNVTTARSLRN